MWINARFFFQIYFGCSNRASLYCPQTIAGLCKQADFWRWSQHTKVRSPVFSFVRASPAASWPRSVGTRPFVSGMLWLLETAAKVSNSCQMRRQLRIVQVSFCFSLIMQCLFVHPLSSFYMWVLSLNERIETSMTALELDKVTFKLKFMLRLVIYYLTVKMTNNFWIWRFDVLFNSQREPIWEFDSL